MSATIPENMLLSDLLKSTGYDCPDSLKDKTFDESTSGGSEVVLEDNKEVTITENGTVEITPSEGKDAMKKVTATVNVAPELDANKEVTVDVSAYTEPVEIEPTEGKDGMKKATITLSNIPSGGGQPSLDIPSWLNEEDATQSVVPNGVKCPLLYKTSSGIAVDVTLYSITGDGIATVEELVQSLHLPYDNISISEQNIYYDNAVEFSVDYTQ